ncbi:MAG: FAD-dependent monooxygenase [Burkholderiaceae bacterium]
MHQPRTEPRQSLYHDYQVHDFVRPAEMDGAGVVHPVAIVGAGPVGLVTALALARLGVRSVLLEAEAQVSEGSRAIVLTRRSMEILQSVGAVAPFVATGLPWKSGRSFFRGHEVYRMEMPHDDDDRFWPGTNTQQQLIEQYLVDAAEASGRVEIRWQTACTGLAQDESGVTLALDTPAGEYQLRARRVVAADGGRSTVRRCLGLRFEGENYPGHFVIADIRADLGLPTERLCFFDPDWNPGNNVLVHREPDGIWRIDFRLPDDETPAAALEPETLAARIGRVLEMVGRPVQWQLDWATVYTANTLTLPDYRAGRVLFAGDAAHLLPIFGVRGANTGFQDAGNLGWKLAMVELGLAPEALLDTYSHERVAAAREICAEGGRSTRFMSPPSPGFRLLRDATLSLVLSQDWPRPLLHWRTSRPHDYSDSPLNTAPTGLDGTAPAPGMPVPDARLGEDDFLLGHLPDGFVLIGFADDAGTLAALERSAAQAPTHGAPLSCLWVVDAGLAGADRVVDSLGRAPARYRARNGDCWLARPDQHLCAGWHQPDGTAIGAAIARALGHDAAAGIGAEANVILESDR